MFLRAALLAVLVAVLAACGGGSSSTAERTPTPTSAAERGAGGAGGARVVGERRVGPRLVDLTIASPAMGGRRMQVRLLVPEGWRRGGAKRYPVLFLLHGCCDTYTSWSTRTDITTLPALRDVLVVMPDGGRAGYYTDWVSGGDPPPRWETFHLRELPALLADGYGAGSRRAIAGLSMGGFGALSYAARHPDLFGAAASFSGVVNPLGAPGVVRGILVGEGEDPDGPFGDVGDDRAHWAEHDPVSLAARLRGKPVFVSAGDGRPGPFDTGEAASRNDGIEVETLAESRDFATAAKRDGVDLTTDFYGPGHHAWPYWERELHRALPVLERGLGLSP